MKRLLLVPALLCSVLLSAQDLTDVQKAAAEAAAAVTEAPEVKPAPVKPRYWTNSLKTQINIGQTSLTSWAAGGDNLSVSMQAFIDVNANYKKKSLFWNNRLQLDYGFLYASSKPILQKNADRIYLESKFGYQAIENLFISANFDFKSQFSHTYDYPNPTKKWNPDTKEEIPFEEGEKPGRKDWLHFKNLKSGFLAPAYTNLALGIDYKPLKWLSINLAPLTGGFVIVCLDELKQSYGMKEKKMNEEERLAFEEAKKGGDPKAIGAYYRDAKFEFGAQMKVDVGVNVNDNFKYTSQLVLFSNYLDHPENMRVNWDNRFDWKLAKYFSLTLLTNLIYDPNIIVRTTKDIEADLPGKQRVQFRESLAFGFTYTIASKK